MVISPIPNGPFHSCKHKSHNKESEKISNNSTVLIWTHMSIWTRLTSVYRQNTRLIQKNQPTHEFIMDTVFTLKRITHIHIIYVRTYTIFFFGLTTGAKSNISAAGPVPRTIGVHPMFFLYWGCWGVRDVVEWWMVGLRWHGVAVVVLHASHTSHYANIRGQFRIPLLSPF